MPFVTKEYILPHAMQAFAFVENCLHYSSKETQRIIDKRRLRYPDGRVIQKSEVICGRVLLDEFVPNGALRAIFVHEDFAVFAKPHNLLTHPKGRFLHASLCDSIKMQFGMQANPVHRLDFETSGVVLISRNKRAEIALKTLFERGEVRKIYRALVEGIIEHERCIESRILLPKKEDKSKDLGIKCQIHASGKDSITIIRPLEVRGNQTLLEIEPLTGRTHQIRLHLASIGHKIVNEPLYGVEEELARAYLQDKLGVKKHLCLHARSLEFSYLGRRYFLSAKEDF
ncbi:pseudouridine synthase family protein [Helicobacter mustelae]|uniref:RNA pseudouridylate synthase n=1 Tax=Helicobacter mustelae (strain ATCC 43772 / CCUG 25715 / CIP 103759 / LMG 18044 / NCTC 12198 / R85-136P) TaxID=679897 RepID=D3UG40_HELM1|nr:RNA pseudouridine synthase [Helicobacter mustelae]CBG39461.1 putative ribosomal pseudouridine synthase [Helicobacter mustelae 12198]SQH70972.1 ribosomal pseudouridine synthase [Helicobacter mustelae]STP12099.1 ribosomal pseudouridine synthase [Helicobacter mustelae]